MTAALWGAVLGGTLGAGLLLVIARLRVMGRAQLSDRVLPYVRDLPQVSPTASPSISRARASCRASSSSTQAIKRTRAHYRLWS